ncbi:hypothetical protein KM043_013346 [Ampulex compressa]|nr:hypothetical protein KM043_013346 [Ampulex compressa]
MGLRRESPEGVSSLLSNIDASSACGSVTRLDSVVGPRVSRVNWEIMPCSTPLQRREPQINGRPLKMRQRPLVLRLRVTKQSS